MWSYGKRGLASLGGDPVLLCPWAISGKPRAVRVLCSGNLTQTTVLVRRSQTSLPAMTLFKSHPSLYLSMPSTIGYCSFFILFPVTIIPTYLVSTLTNLDGALLCSSGKLSVGGAGVALFP